MSIKKNKVVIFVLGYRAIDFLKNGSLDSIILASRKIDNSKVDIVYLDNYSRDGSIQYLLKEYPNIDLLLSPKNYLYCKGINVGIQYAYQKYKPNYFILADADNPCEPNAYKELVDFANKNTSIGIIQPQVRSLENHSIIYSCGHFYQRGIFCKPFRIIPINRKRLLNLPSCSISSTLIKTKVFEVCGLLDPIFEIYYESSDISFRARKAGFRCACHLKAISYNKRTMIDYDNFHKCFYRNRNSLIFWKKHDENNYRKLLNIQLKKYNTLNKKLSQQKYVTNIIDESTRKGIEEGLEITRKKNFNKNHIVHIKDFSKTDIILLQKAKRNL
jgi:hypothetical protein